MNGLRIDLFGMTLSEDEIDRLGVLLLVVVILGILALFGIARYFVK